jgi:hypothetical protein
LLYVVHDVVGDAGEDTLVYDLADARIDGGNGTDTLQVAGSGVRIDLTSLTDDVITNVEIIDLGGRGIPQRATAPRHEARRRRHQFEHHSPAVAARRASFGLFQRDAPFGGPATAHVPLN